eukprot:gene20015-10019_t
MRAPAAALLLFASPAAAQFCPMDVKTCECGQCWDGTEVGRDACCQFQCPAEPNCLTKEQWSAEKTAWCCAHQQLGCPVVCPAD